MRGFAALSIFVFHFFALYPFARGPLFESMAPTVLGYFGQAVPLFYALSGLSLCMGFFERRASPYFLREFFIRRFMRIAPLFYVATLVWSGILGSRGAPPLPGQVVASVTFAFNLLPGYHESVVAAGWSVGVEMLFYAIFPLIVTFVTGARYAVAFFGMTCVLAVISFRSLSEQFPKTTYATMCSASNLHYFATGILIYFLARSARRRLAERAWMRFGISMCSVLGLIAPLWVLTSPRFLGSFDAAVARIVWAVPIAALLSLGVRYERSSSLVRPFARLGEWSYSLYLMHPIWIYFVFQYLKEQRTTSLGESERFGLYLSFGLVGLVTLASLTFRVVERPFMRLGSRWAKPPS